MQDRSKASVLVKNFSISSDDELLLAELSETIIPKTSSPGAKDLSAHLFLLKMVDDCNSKEDQEKFTSGLRAFDKQFEKITGKQFLKASATERAEALTKLFAADSKTDETAAFLSTVKRYTIQAYTASEYFLTKVQPYELVPGRYSGCVPVKASA
jgi:Gluconate 2-dehydrogenase subunit 3